MQNFSNCLLIPINIAINRYSNKSIVNNHSINVSKPALRFESKRRIEDDICKKVADIRMSPWSEGQELGEAQAATARAR